VSSLAKTQLRMRGAVVDGEIAAIAPLLVGGRDPARRLAIHGRHYRASLVAAVQSKFRATAWLLGTPVLFEAAQEFVQQHPPGSPCIAEYGEQFPHFLSQHAGAARVPYLYSFAQLEWHLGQVAIAIDRPAATRDALSALEINTLMDTCLALQGGLRYLHSPWPVDELMKLYLSDTAPSEYCLVSEDIWLEVQGARGDFHFSRLDAAKFVFRKAILQGKSIGNAVEQALEVDARFDIGRAFTTLIDSGRVIGAALPERKGEE
jgi:Putative DNA-binding domain